MKKIILCIILLCLAVIISAQTIEKKDAGNYRIKGEAYTAETDDINGGYLHSIKVRNKEYIDNFIDTNRGSFMLFDGDTPAPITDKKLDGNTLTLTTSVGTLIYDFYKDRIEITVTDTIGEGFLRLVFNHLVNLARNEKGEYIEHYILERQKGTFTFLRGRGGLQISGDAECFGPVVAGFAADLTFKAGETKKMVITPIHNPTEEDYIRTLAIPIGDVKLYTPQNYQVFQRYNKNTGTVSINGTVGEGVTEISYKISGKDLNNKSVSKDWTPIKIERAGAFNTKFDFSAGGWYKLELKYIKEGKENIYAVDNVGIGEIIFGAGQSNSTNCGEERIKTETKMVADTDGIRWRLCDDPMISPHDGEDGGSFWPALGDILYKEFNVPIACVSCGWGGTKTEQWMPTAENLVGSTVKTNINLYEYMMWMINRFGTKGFRCLLWHQGESDLHTPDYQYYNNMCDIIWASKRDAGWDIPWFTAKASFIPQKILGGKLVYGFNDVVIQAQQKLWDNGISFQGPNTDQLQGDYRDHEGTGVHFSPKGLREHARLWSEFIIPYIHEQID